MALTSGGLAGEIKKAMMSLTDKNSDLAMQKLGQAISRYLIQNTDIVFSWTGVMPGVPPVPDPVISYTTKKVIGSFICTSTRTNNSVLQGIKLGKQITDGIKSFLIFPALGWSLPPQTFLGIPPIILPPYPTTDIDCYWRFQSNIIITFYKSWVNPSPLAGVHGSFIGTPGAIMTSIF